MKTLRILGVVAVSAATLALLPATSASADDTDVTFSLTGGNISLLVASNAALSNGVAGAASVSGPLGGATLTDNRGGTLGWSVSASSSVFTGTTGSNSTGVSYDTGAVTTGGAGASNATAAAAGSIMAVRPVAGATTVSGNNTATWSPNLTVSLPGSALVGNYAGTVTTSIV